MYDWWYNILDFLPAKNGLFVCKDWYSLLRDRSIEENSFCRFVKHWIVRYKMTKLFLNRILYDLNFRLNYLYIHDTPTPHICITNDLPYFCRHISRIDFMRTVEYEKMWQYLIQLHPEMWDIAFRNTVIL